MIDRSTAMDKIVANTLETKFEDFDKETLQNGRERILDTFGCLIGGSKDPSNPEFVKLIMDFGGKPESTILMYGGKVPACHAAMANCITCRSFDFEPVSPIVEDVMAPGHVSGTTVMTAFSLGEALGASGRDVITAMLLGDDLAARLLATSGFTLMYGWDGNGTANGLAATAIAGRLLKLDKKQMRNAFALALNQLSGSAQNIWEGTTAFKLPIGLAAKTGIFSAQLALTGWTANQDPLFGKYGYYDLFTKGICNEDYLLRDIGKKYWGDRTFKPYPCCRGNHSPIDCALDIVNDHNVNAEDVVEVTLYMEPHAKDNFCGQPWEPGDFPHGSAIFSYRFTVATAFLKKSVKPQHFTREAIFAPGTSEFIKKIKFGDLPKGETGFAMKVRTKDGSEYTSSSQVARGDIAGNPISKDDLLAKFWNNVEFDGRLSKGKAGELVERLENFDKLGNVSEIVPLLVP